MSEPVRILLEADCLGNVYDAGDPPSASSVGILRYVIDADEDIASSLHDALNVVYPGYRWSSPGDSELRRLCSWLVWGDRLSDVEGHPEGRQLLELIALVRARMDAAFSSGAYEHHLWPEVPDAIRRWQRDGHQVLSFTWTTPGSAERQTLQIGRPEVVIPLLNVPLLDLPDIEWAEPEPLVLAESFLRTAGPHNGVPLVVVGAESSGIARELSSRGLSVVLVDRTWVATSYYEPGYGFFVANLTEIDPKREVTRLLSES